MLADAAEPWGGLPDYRCGGLRRGGSRSMCFSFGFLFCLGLVGHCNFVRIGGLNLSVLLSAKSQRPKAPVGSTVLAYISSESDSGYYGSGNVQCVK